MEESQSVRNLAVDPVEEKMYFMSGRIVSRAKFDGSGKEIIRESGVSAFALDSVERSMYWSIGYHILTGNMNFSDGKLLSLRARENNFEVDPYSRLVIHFPTFSYTMSET